MTVQFEITKKDVLLQVKTEAFVTGEANKDGELSRINHATKHRQATMTMIFLMSISIRQHQLLAICCPAIFRHHNLQIKKKSLFSHAKCLIHTIRIRTGLSQTASKIICRPILYTNGIKGWLQTWQTQVNWKLSGLISIIG